MLYKLFNFVFLFILFSCECPQFLDTDKEIIPNEYSFVSVINKNSDYRYIDIFSKKVLLAENIENSDFLESRYFKFAAGFTNLLIKKIDTTIYNSIIYTKKNNYYTIFFYGTKENPKNILIEDFLADSLDNAYLRIADLSDFSKIVVKVISSLPQPIEVNLSKNEITKIIPMASGSVNVQVYDFNTNELISNLENIQISSKTISNIIITGDSSEIKLSISKIIK